MTEQIKKFKEKEKYTVDDIRELVEILRSENGCQWDREQDHKSVRNAMIEETYEFIEGLDNDDAELIDELSKVDNSKAANFDKLCVWHQEKADQSVIAVKPDIYRSQFSY
jgi:hypothetical protein